MSQQLISRSPDLKRLRDEGYDVRIVSGYLVIGHVPYVNSKKEIKYGALVSKLEVAGDTATPPGTHVASFAGEYPCGTNGMPLEKIRHQTAITVLDRERNLTIHHSFSSKPQPSGRYADNYEKMTTYVAILSTPAEALDPSVTAKIFPVIETDERESVFHYEDTASSRAEINVVTAKLAVAKIAIIGVGGTGSYVLDLVCKTPVKEIHVYDGDRYLNHNAFRSPGAPSLDELRAQPKKVAYLSALYSRMHRHIIPHEEHIDVSNIDRLRGMSFVFLCLDGGKAKRLIVNKLEEYQVPFVDVGMGLEVINEALVGVLRVTTSTVQKREHVSTNSRIPFSDGDGNEDYSHNIQIADLNALNAALAVIKWKKLCGFYADLEREHHSTYTIDGNTLTNEDR